MKEASDTLQILLSFPAGCDLLALAFMLLTKAFFRVLAILRHTIRLTLSEAGRWLPNLNPIRGGAFNWLLLFSFGLLLQSFSSTVSDAVQVFEQTYLSPVYLSPDTSSAVSAAFERKLQTRLGAAEYNLFIRRTADIAAQCGSTPLSFYNVYESECGCDPFAVNINERGDTVAAGQIQFTRAGIDGLVLNGSPVTFRQVKDAVRGRKIEWLLDLQAAYMERARCGRMLPRPCDVYTAVFIPAGLGGSDSSVLASAKSSKPEYYFQNIGLDGYALTDSGKILYLKSQRDGAITINDLRLCLAYKQAKVVDVWGGL